MPEHLRALVVILLLAGIVFAFAKRPACALASSSADFERRRNLWFAVTLIAFLSHQVWVFIFATALLLLAAAPRDSNRLALFFFLLFALPKTPVMLPGFGVVNYLFEIDYVRLLVLTLLLPALLSLYRQADVERFGRFAADKLLAGYLLLSAALMFPQMLTSATVRFGVVYPLLECFVPYYVASRYIRDMRGFRDALMALVVATMVVSAIGAFEFARGWLLYSALDSALGVPWSYTGYLMRGENLRATVTAGQPIPMGFVIAVGFGCLIALRKSIPSATAWRLGLMVLLAGLICSLSRGPWIGAAAMVLMMIATGPKPIQRFWKLALLGIVVLPLLLVTPAGQAIIDHLPFVGTVDAGAVAFRQRLLEISMDLVMENPLLGSFSVMGAEALRELDQGLGMIDIVNTYVGIALSRGLIGLLLFAGFFVSVGWGIYRAMQRLTDSNDERLLLGRALLSILFGIAIIIFTVSSISFIPVIYWTMAGLGVAYVRMVTRSAGVVVMPKETARLGPLLHGRKV